MVADGVETILSLYNIMALSHSVWMCRSTLFCYGGFAIASLKSFCRNNDIARTEMHLIFILCSLPCALCDLLIRGKTLIVQSHWIFHWWSMIMLAKECHCCELTLMYLSPSEYCGPYAPLIFPSPFSTYALPFFQACSAASTLSFASDTDILILTAETMLRAFSISSPTGFIRPFSLAIVKATILC